MKKAFLSAASLACFIFIATTSFAAETLIVGGGSAPMENIFKRIKEPFRQKTGITLELREIGPVESLVEVLDNKADIASGGVSSMVNYRTLAANKLGEEFLTSAQTNHLKFKQIGYDAVTVFVHPDLPVYELSKEQLVDIFSGKVTNWKDVRLTKKRTTSVTPGPNLPIVVVLGNKVEGLMRSFKNNQLREQQYSPKAVYVDTAEQMSRKVSQTPGAISIGTLSAVHNTKAVKNVEYPFVRRPIAMVYDKDSPKTSSINKLIEFIESEEGQKLIITASRGY